MNKKWLITIGVILGIVALGAAGYFAWQNRTRIAQVIPAIVGGGEIAPIEKTESKLKAISSREVESYWVTKTASSSEIFYLDGSKAVVKIGQDGVETVDSTSVKNPISVSPSVAGDMLFAQLGKDGDSEIYDLVKNVKIRNFIGVGSVAWGEGGKIAMTILGNDTGSVAPQVVMVDMNDTKKPAKTILKMGLTGFDLQWPQKDAVYLTQKPSAEYVSEMWKVDLKTGALKKILADRGLIVRWAPFGDRALEFTTNAGREHKLSLIDGDGNRLKEFKFVTLPDKCIMTTASQVYCAIPRDQEVLTHMTLPDDYLKRSAYFKDGIYQIDIDKDSIRGIFEDENPDIDATDLTIMGDKLLFINRYDRKLYSLNLQ